MRGQSKAQGAPRQAQAGPQQGPALPVQHLLQGVQAQRALGSPHGHTLGQQESDLHGVRQGLLQKGPSQETLAQPRRRQQWQKQKPSGLTKWRR